MGDPTNYKYDKRSRVVQQKIDYYYMPYNKEVECIKGMTTLDSSKEVRGDA